jgi:hypothetical protein
MKKSSIIILNLIFLSSITFAQNSEYSRGKVNLGIKGGINYSNNYDSDDKDFTAENKVGFAGGVFFAIPIGKFVGVQPEILYSQKGYKQSGVFLGGNYELTRTTDYLDIPILLSIKPAKFITIQAGPQFSYLLKQKDVFTNPLSTIEQENEFKNDKIRKNILGVIGGFDFNLNKVVLGLRAGLDIQNNNGDGTSTNPRYRNAWSQATLGFRIL